MATHAKRVIASALVAGLIIIVSGLLMVPVIGTAWGLVEVMVAGEVGASLYNEKRQR